MSDTREQFLSRVSDAVAAGNRAGHAPADIPDRGSTGYQGAGDDPVARFLRELKAAGGQGVAVADVDEAADVVETLLNELGAKRVLLGRWNLPTDFDAVALIRATGAELLDASSAAPADALSRYATADVGLTGCDYLIAETGSVVVLSQPEQPRSLSLLPPVHIVVARVAQLLPDVFDLFSLPGGLPSGMALITGPSKTGDIEGKLVTGVHGPGELHVVVIAS